jgi:hypothetical protein
MKPLLTIFVMLWVSVLWAADGPVTFKVSELTFKRPAAWEWVESTSSMRKAQLKVSDADKKNTAEVVFFPFWAEQRRWRAGERGPLVRPVPGATRKAWREERGNHHRQTQSHLRARRRHLPERHPRGARTPQPGYALRGAIIESAEGDVFVKMTGPATLVKSAEADFRKLIESALK